MAIIQMRSEMKIRKAVFSDLDQIQNVYYSAKQFMRQTGNPNQWASGYPSNELLLADMERDSLFVIEDNSTIHAVFVLLHGPDPTYSYIEGSWLNDEDYFVIHRIASDNTLHHILPAVLDFADQYTDTIRIDTHADNKVMQHLLSKYGFTHCGTIYLSDGSPRLAYQRTI